MVTGKFKSMWEVARTTYRRYSDDNAGRLAAAVAFYAVFSIAPLLIIATAVAGFIFDEQDVHWQVASYLEQFVGPASRDFVVELIQNWQKRSSGVLATIIGLGTLSWGAYRLFTALQDLLNMIWQVRPRRGLTAREWLRLRLVPFGMVLVVGLLLLASMVALALLSAMQRFFAGFLPVSVGLASLGDFVVSILLMTGLVAAVFKILPDVVLQWRQVWGGAALTAFMLVLGKSAIALYLGHTSITSIFGASGSLVALLFWVYFSAQIFFVGAEFTQVSLAHRGVEIVPKPHAMRAPRRAVDAPEVSAKEDG